MSFSIKCCARSAQFIQSVRKIGLMKGTGIGCVFHNEGGSLRTQILLNIRKYSYLSKTDRKFCTVSKFKFQFDMKTPEECRLGIAYISSRSMKTKEPQGIHENISALQMKTRAQRRKRSALEEEDSKKLGYFNVVAYATAEEYDLEKLTKGLLDQNLYKPVPQLRSPERTQVVPDVLHVTARYEVGDEPREIYFFREGTTVFWNMPELETSNVLSFIRQFEENSYDERLVQDESEVMPYTHITGKNSHLDNGDIVLGDEGNSELDKYTFANAMALSVKLGIWEASLNRYVDSIEYVTEDLKRGKKISMSQDDVLRKTGELFVLRHVINLSSDLLDTPDFYWDHEEQENLYQQMCGYFSISRRTRVMNERLSHCLELVELLSTHLSDKHHTRLEWMIIILIMVEVGFEIIHYIDRYM